MSIEHGVAAGAPKSAAKTAQAGLHGQGAGKAQAATTGDFASLLMSMGADELVPQAPGSDAAPALTAQAADPAALPADAGLAVPALPATVPVVAAEVPVVAVATVSQTSDASVKLSSSAGEVTAVVLPSTAATRTELRTPQTTERATEPPTAVDAPASLVDAAGIATNAVNTAAPVSADGLQPLLRQAALTQRMAQQRGQAAELAGQPGKEQRGEDVAARLGWRLSEQLAPVSSPTLAAVGESSLRPFERRGERSGPRIGGVGEAVGWSGVPQADGARMDVPAVAPDGGLTTEMRVAEQVSYWIGRGAQNAELEVDGLGEGPVKVSIEMQGQEARVEFRADQAQTRQVLQDSMPHLRDLLEQEGLVLSGMSIGSSGAGGGQGQSTDERPGQRRGQVAMTEVPVVARAGHRAAPLAGRSVDLFV